LHKLGEHLNAFAESRLDIATWAQGIRTSDLWSLFQDEAVVKHIRARIADRVQFFGVMAQLYVWGLIRQRGISCTMQEKDSLPDLLLHLGQNVVIPSEVKDFHTSKNPNNLADVISKANKQIKVVDPGGSGLLFLRIRRSTLVPGTNDGYPADIAPHIAACMRFLTFSKYRSVAKIIAFWDDLAIVNAQGVPFYFFRRNSRVLEHPGPRKPVPIQGKDLALGQTLEIWIERQSKTARSLRPGEKPLPRPI
jgi:hypothetical protein